MSSNIGDEPLVSVILPVFNGGAPLLPAVMSIVNQTYRNWELLIVDDGSTDGAIDQVRSMAEPRVKVISDGINKGLATRLNEAVSFAAGAYIARMDADDVSFPLRLSEQVNYLENHKEIDLVGCQAVAFKGVGDLIGLLPFAADHEALCAQPWRNIPLPHPTWMGRQPWFKVHPYRLPEVLRAEDQELLLRSYTSSKFACLDQVLLGYRQGPFNLRRTLIARKALLAAQIGLFRVRGEWRNVALAIALSSVKVLVDVAASIPGLESLFFKRMNEPVPASVQELLCQCLTVKAPRLND